MGIGTVAAIHVVRRARAKGLILLTATTLWENQAAHALTRRLGFRPLASRGREVEWELALVSRPSYRATTAGAAKPQSTRPVPYRAELTGDGVNPATPRWASDHFVFNTAATEIKGRALMRNGWGSICVDDQQPPYCSSR